MFTCCLKDPSTLDPEPLHYSYSADILGSQFTRYQAVFLTQSLSRPAYAYRPRTRREAVHHERALSHSSVWFIVEISDKVEFEPRRDTVRRIVFPSDRLHIMIGIKSLYAYRTKGATVTGGEIVQLQQALGLKIILKDYMVDVCARNTFIFVGCQDILHGKLCIGAVFVQLVLDPLSSCGACNQILPEYARGTRRQPRGVELAAACVVGHSRGANDEQLRERLSAIRPNGRTFQVDTYPVGGHGERCAPLPEQLNIKSRSDRCGCIVVMTIIHSLGNDGGWMRKANACHVFVRRSRRRNRRRR